MCFGQREKGARLYLTVLVRERTTIPCSTVNDITETKTAKHTPTDVKMSTIHRENINKHSNTHTNKYLRSSFWCDLLVSMNVSL